MVWLENDIITTSAIFDDVDAQEETDLIADRDERFYRHGGI